jgi:hypothetical protein
MKTIVNALGLDKKIELPTPDEIKTDKGKLILLIKLIPASLISQLLADLVFDGRCNVELLMIVIRYQNYHQQNKLPLKFDNNMFENLRIELDNSLNELVSLITVNFLKTKEEDGEKYLIPDFDVSYKEFRSRDENNENDRKEKEIILRLNVLENKIRENYNHIREIAIIKINNDKELLPNGQSKIDIVISKINGVYRSKENGEKLAYSRLGPNDKILKTILFMVGQKPLPIKKVGSATNQKEKVVTKAIKRFNEKFKTDLDLPNPFIITDSFNLYSIDTDRYNVI